MDHQQISESVAQQLARAWETHRTPAFVEYLLQTFGCEPLMPIRFGGIFALQMIGGYFYPDLPPGRGQIVERLWLIDDAGYRLSSIDELCAVENLESENPLVVYDSSRTSYEPIDCSQPWLLVYPRFKFCVREDRLIYYEQYGFAAGCTKVEKLVIGDQVSIQNVCVTRTIWQGHLKGVTHA